MDVDGALMPRALSRAPSSDVLRLIPYGEEDELPSLTPASMVATFRHMEQRKLDRRLRGVVTTSDGWAFQAVVLLTVLAWCVGIVRLEVPHSDAEAVLRFSIQVGAGVVGVVLLILAFTYVLLRLARVMRWVMYWAACVALLMTYESIRKDVSVLLEPDQLATELRAVFWRWGLALLVSLEVVTVVAWLVYHRLVPYLLVHASDDHLIRLYNLRLSPPHESGDAGVAFRYSPPWWPLLARVLGGPKYHSFYYAGQVLNQCPHGYGEWRDDASRGECLRGYWHQGQPLAPFTSREHRSGYSLAAVHVISVTARAEPFTQTWLRPRRQTGAALTFVVTAVECSVSGSFFVGYPRSNVLYATAASAGGRGDAVGDLNIPGASVGAKTGVAALAEDVEQARPGPPHAAQAVEEDDAADTCAAGAHGASSPPHRDGDALAAARNRNEMRTCLRMLRHHEDGMAGHSSIPSLSRHPSSTTCVPPEVLLYIHGFNCSAEEGCGRLGQLLALGRFPPHIKPLQFSWPTGKILTYPAALEYCRSAELGRDLCACLRAIREAGVRDVHVLVHSMGAAAFVAHLDTIATEVEPHRGGTWRTAEEDRPGTHSQGQESLPRLRLVTVTLANPELFEDDFWPHTFPRLCSVCPHISIYGDRDDGALFWSEKANRGRLSLGKLHHVPYALPAPPPERLRERLSDSQASGLVVAAHHRAMQHAGTTHLTSAEPTWADVDIIDLTWLDTNVHPLRHNAFNLNRMMVDDIRDIIVHRVRARERRSRLIRRCGNEFSFLQPPSHIVND